jgi:hypothetical protein
MNMMFRKTIAVIALAGLCSIAAAQPALKVVTVSSSEISFRFLLRLSPCL